MPPGKGYILMTDSTTHPKAFPRLGTIIQDPLRPNDTSPLSELADKPEITVHPDKHKIVLSSDFDVNGSVWAQFCENIIHAHIGAGIGRKVVMTYETTRLETHYMTKPLDLAQVKSRIDTDDVKDAMNVGGLKGSPVFIVSGLKIARGFKRSMQTTSNRNIDTAFGAKVTEEAGAGADAHASKSTGFSEEAEVLPAPEEDPGRHDIVFAYQLHIVARRQWWQFWRKPLTVRKHEPSGGFSSSGQSEKVQEIEVEHATSHELEAAMQDEEYEADFRMVRDTFGGEAVDLFCVIPPKDMLEEARKRTAR